MKGIKRPKIRKKHSKILAKLALKTGLIDKKFYKDLYIESFVKFKCSTRKRGKRKNNKYRFSRYYDELFFCTTDYFGESDETSLIDFLKEIIYWKHVEVIQSEQKKEVVDNLNDNGFLQETNYDPPKIIGGKILNTLQMIKYFRSILKNESFSKRLERR